MTTSRQFGQLEIFGDGSTAVLTGPHSAGQSTTVPATLEALRDWLRFDDLGRYRPLPGARTMRGGWRLQCHEGLTLPQAVAVAYPQVERHIVARQEGTLRVVSLEEVLSRQFGRYAVANELPQSARDVAADTVCARCVKSPLWRPTTGPLTEGTSLPLPCPEPCSVVVSLCREAALWEDGPPALAAENLTVAWAAFDQPGNEIREAYLRARFPEKWLLNPEPRTSRVLPSEQGDEPAPPNPGAR